MLPEKQKVKSNIHLLPSFTLMLQDLLLHDHLQYPLGDVKNFTPIIKIKSMYLTLYQTTKF